jgi:hypothetical protein
MAKRKIVQKDKIIYIKKCWGDCVWGGYEVGESLLSIRAILTGVIL